MGKTRRLLAPSEPQWWFVMLAVAGGLFLVATVSAMYVAAAQIRFYRSTDGIDVELNIETVESLTQSMRLLGALAGALVLWRLLLHLRLVPSATTASISLISAAGVAYFSLVPIRITIGVADMRGQIDERILMIVEWLPWMALTAVLVGIAAFACTCVTERRR